MTNSASPTVVPATASRPVLLWRPDSDETQVQAILESAAKFLNVSADAVTTAIDKGDLLEGWFVDWEAKAA